MIVRYPQNRENTQNIGHRNNKKKLFDRDIAARNYNLYTEKNSALKFVKDQNQLKWLIISHYQSISASNGIENIVTKTNRFKLSIKNFRKEIEQVHITWSDFADRKINQ